MHCMHSSGSFLRTNLFPVQSSADKCELLLLLLRELESYRMTIIIPGFWLSFQFF